jgi:hypothetical protein
MCVDYRQLNDKSVKFALPLPRCDEVVSQAGGAKYFTTLDLQWGFLQMENDPSTAEYIAFTIPGRHYHFNVLPFGVTNGPGVSQRPMSTVLDGLLGIHALNYIDDILITGKTMDEICLNMNIAFDRLEQANFMVGFEKVFHADAAVSSLGSSSTNMVFARILRKLRRFKTWYLRKPSSKYDNSSVSSILIP